MSHYFETPAGQISPHPLPITIWARRYELQSAPGVFSQHRLDPGTAVLLRTLSPPADRPARFLDLGCGYGPIAIALATECPSAQVDAVDVNEHAVHLATMNAANLGVSDRISAFTPDRSNPDIQYDEIWSNPPIRIGKEALHHLLRTWLDYLSPTGIAHLVVARNLGADSLSRWLTDQGWDVTKVGSSKGYRVLNVTARPSPFTAPTQ